MEIGDYVYFKDNNIIGVKIKGGSRKKVQIEYNGITQYVNGNKLFWTKFAAKAKS